MGKKFTDDPARIPSPMDRSMKRLPTTTEFLKIKGEAKKFLEYLTDYDRKSLNDPVWQKEHLLSNIVGLLTCFYPYYDDICNYNYYEAIRKEDIKRINPDSENKSHSNTSENDPYVRYVYWGSDLKRKSNKLSVMVMQTIFNNDDYIARRLSDINYGGLLKDYSLCYLNPSGNCKFEPFYLGHAYKNDAKTGLYVVYLFNIEDNEVYLTIAQGASKPIRYCPVGHQSELNHIHADEKAANSKFRITDHLRNQLLLLDNADYFNSTISLNGMHNRLKRYLVNRYIDYCKYNKVEDFLLNLDIINEYYELNSINTPVYLKYDSSSSSYILKQNLDQGKLKSDALDYEYSAIYSIKPYNTQKIYNDLVLPYYEYKCHGTRYSSAEIDLIERKLESLRVAWTIDYLAMLQTLIEFRSLVERNIMRYKNVIYFGAPGTGKSFLLNRDLKSIVNSNNSNDKKNYSYFERITLYDSYTYAQFVGSYKPIPTKYNEDSDRYDKNSLSISYEFVAGPFIRVFRKALLALASLGIDGIIDYFTGRKNIIRAINNENQNEKKQDSGILDDISCVLVIEELNRADPASVFGDVFQLLDRQSNGLSEYCISVSEELRNWLYVHLQEEPNKQAAQSCEVDPRAVLGLLVSLACTSTDGITSETIRNYLKQFEDHDSEDHPTFIECCDKLVLPPNMYIWATMNSADQGVYPVDTAFKRRWNFEYINIDNGEENVDRTWNQYRRFINRRLLDLHIEEDKLLGAYFLGSESVRNSSMKKIARNGKKKTQIDDQDTANWAKVFENKVLMYLFEDAAKYQREDLFSDEIKPLTLQNICDTWNEKCKTAKGNDWLAKEGPMSIFRGWEGIESESRDQDASPRSDGKKK